MADSPTRPFDISLLVLECLFSVRCCDEASNTLIRTHYILRSLFQRMPAHKQTRANEIIAVDNAGGWQLQDANATRNCRDPYQLAYEFEKTMTEQLQLLRPDLFFVHGAALSRSGQCVVVAGASGSGKSSIAWYLCDNGFEVPQ